MQKPLTHSFKSRKLQEKQQPLPQANLKNTLCEFLGISKDKSEPEINEEIISLLEEDASAFKTNNYEDSPEELSDALKTLIAGFSASKTGQEHPRFQRTILNLTNDNDPPSFSYEENVANPKPNKKAQSITSQLGSI